MKYIITSVQLGGKVNKNFLTNLLNFSRENSVDKIYAFVQRGQYVEETYLDPLIEDSGIEIIYKEMKLNSNLKLYDTRILPQQINPFTGMNMKLSRDFSYILPSPKIRFESIANTGKHARAFMSTGALTEPEYKESTAAGVKAKEQHQYGFIFVEVVNNRIFHPYQIESLKNGDFYFLNKWYCKNTTIDAQPEAFIVGDWHPYETCQWVRKETISMIETLDPKRVVFHDFFSGISINHHETHSLLARARKSRDSHTRLRDEVQYVYDEMVYFAEKFPHIQFLVARSNHDEFLLKYIDSYEFAKDHQNIVFAANLYEKIINEDAIPLREALQMIGDIPVNFHFAQYDESWRIKGVELANHGHKGSNGSRGTPSNFRSLNLKQISGHTHSPMLYSNGMVVGTSTILKPEYAKGSPSSWMNAHGILYSNGKYGLLTLIR